MFSSLSLGNSLPRLRTELAVPRLFSERVARVQSHEPDMEAASVRWILARTEVSGCRRLHVQYMGQRARVQLTPPFVSALKQHGEGSIKITLDGDREAHDQARAYRDGRSTFDTLFANLLPGQEESYERLLKHLEHLDLLRHIDSVKFKPVVEAHRNGLYPGAQRPSKAQTLARVTQSVTCHARN